MSGPGRLAEEKSGKSGVAIDRKVPVRFILDGQTVTGFAGDTVLSAQMASGVNAVGTFAGHPVALSARFSPAVSPAKLSDDAASAVPMARLPAVNGAELVTTGRPPSTAGAASIRQMFSRRDGSLGLKFDRPGEFVEAWRVAPADEMVTVDLVVVGGGVAGMSAAIAGSSAGKSVLLVERQAALGGDAAFYGAVEDEEAPEATIARLIVDLEKRARITVRLNTEAIRLSGEIVSLHGLVEGKDGWRGQRIDVRAGAVVLATGSIERLPVFAGNRLPGVYGAIAAWHDLRQHALWPGQQTVIATQGNFAYRLGLQAADCGVAVRRIIDTRLNPQSRFIDFCKASGVTLATGLVPQTVVPQQRGEGLAIGLAATIDGIPVPADPLQADRLVVAGGWQPDLTLWCRAGGQTVWSRETARLQPVGSISGIALAGSAAGLRNNSACAASGTAATARLFDRPAPEFSDTQIPDIYETPDDPTPIVAVTEIRAGPAFLDAGATLMHRPIQRPRRFIDRLLRRTEPAWTPLDEGHALGLCDLVASIQLGVVEAQAAGALARERCVSPAQFSSGHVPLSPGTDEALVPAFLEARFGPKPSLWTVLADDTRFFDTGCLLFADPADVDPAKALGAIVGPAPDRRNGGLALIGRPDVAPGQRLVVRDENGPVSVRLIAAVEQPAPRDTPPESAAK